MLPVSRSQRRRVRWHLQIVLVGVALLVVAPEAGLLAGDGNSGELRISVTISPAPCRYPDPCRLSSVDSVSRLIVSDSEILYVGSPPVVIRSNGMLSILL